MFFKCILTIRTEPLQPTTSLATALNNAVFETFLIFTFYFYVYNSQYNMHTFSVDIGSCKYNSLRNSTKYNKEN